MVETISFITYRWGDSTNLQHDGNVLFSLPYMRLVEFHPCQAAYAISNIKTTCYLARKNAELYLAHLPLISTLIDIIYILLLLSHSTVFCYFWDQDFPLSLKYVIRPNLHHYKHVCLCTCLSVTKNFTESKNVTNKSCHTCSID